MNTTTGAEEILVQCYQVHFGTLFCRTRLCSKKKWREPVPVKSRVPSILFVWKSWNFLVTREQNFGNRDRQALLEDCAGWSLILGMVQSGLSPYESVWVIHMHYVAFNILHLSPNTVKQDAQSRFRRMWLVYGSIMAFYLNLEKLGKPKRCVMLWASMRLPVWVGLMCLWLNL